MNMVDLIVLLCSLANPTVCQERHMLFESHGSLETCMREAQPYLAQWISEHPDLRVARYRCDWPDREREGT
jgi:hypothetical protein